MKLLSFLASIIIFNTSMAICDSCPVKPNRNNYIELMLPFNAQFAEFNNQFNYGVSFTYQAKNKLRYGLKGIKQTNPFALNENTSKIDYAILPSFGYQMFTNRKWNLLQTNSLGILRRNALYSVGTNSEYITGKHSSYIFQSEFSFRYFPTKFVGIHAPTLALNLGYSSSFGSFFQEYNTGGFSSSGIIYNHLGGVYTGISLGLTIHKTKSSGVVF